LEFQVLTAASNLEDRADLNSITAMVDDWTGGDRIVDVHSAVEDLVKRGLMKARRFKADGDQRSQMRFDVTEDGHRAIRRAHAEAREMADAPDGMAREQAR